jgi:phosphohistidine phosphatase SixA
MGRHGSSQQAMAPVRRSTRRRQAVTTGPRNLKNNSRFQSSRDEDDDAQPPRGGAATQQGSATPPSHVPSPAPTAFQPASSHAAHTTADTADFLLDDGETPSPVVRVRSITTVAKGAQAGEHASEQESDGLSESEVDSPTQQHGDSPVGLQQSHPPQRSQSTLKFMLSSKLKHTSSDDDEHKRASRSLTREGVNERGRTRSVEPARGPREAGESHPPLRLQSPATRTCSTPVRVQQITTVAKSRRVEELTSEQESDESSESEVDSPTQQHGDSSVALQPSHPPLRSQSTTKFMLSAKLNHTSSDDHEHERASRSLTRGGVTVNERGRMRNVEPARGPKEAGERNPSESAEVNDSLSNDITTSSSEKQRSIKRTSSSGRGKMRVVQPAKVG